MVLIEMPRRWTQANVKVGQQFQVGLLGNCKKRTLKNIQNGPARVLFLNYLKETTLFVMCCLVFHPEHFGLEHFV